MRQTTDESPICDMNSISFPMNITVAVAPDSSSSVPISSLDKMKIETVNENRYNLQLVLRLDI